MAAGSTNTREIAEAFTAARTQGFAVREFPGVLPASLDEAYRVQDRAISLWPDTIGGWKIGLIQPGHRSNAGAERLAGPIFSRQIFKSVAGAVLDMPVFRGGFAAVEAEFVLRLKGGLPHDAPITPDTVAGIVESLHVGVEIASSPFAAINELGPMSVVSDFGNNNGLIVGAAIEGWQNISLNDLSARVEIDGQTVGTASAAAIPGGPVAALRFLIELCRERGIELKSGDYVSTGAVTGVHEAPIGSTSCADFGDYGLINLRLVASAPSEVRQASA